MTASTTAHAAARMSLPRLVLTILLPFSMCYFLSYLYRAVNAVIAPNLVSDVGLDASELGLLTAAYLIGFAGFQIPLGMLLDRFGPRKVQALLLCVGAVGALIFAWAAEKWGLSFGRMLIGMGSAGGLMAGFKAVSIWVPEDRRALANACIMAVGGLGILTATVPAEWATANFGWRAMFAGIAALTIAVACFLFTVVPERPPHAASLTGRSVLSAIGTIYADPVFWRVAPFVALTAGCHIGIQTLWAGPWLRDVAGLDRAGVAAVLGLQAIGFLVGTLMSGYVADWLVRRGVSLLVTMTGFIIAFMSIQLAILFEPVALNAPVWFIFGMFGQAGILAYPWLAQYFGADLAGRSNGCLNTLVFGVAFISQYAIGAIIDPWPLKADGGYENAAYQVSFGVFLALQALSLVWFVLKMPKGTLRRQS
jgi:MFS family permease